MKACTSLAGLILIASAGCAVDATEQDESIETTNQGLVGIHGDKVATFRNGDWWIDMNGSGLWDAGDAAVTGWGEPGDIPLSYPLGKHRCGVPNVTVLAVYRPSTRQYLIDANNNRRWDAADIAKGPWGGSAPDVTEIPFVFSKSLGGLFPQCVPRLGVFRYGPQPGSKADWLVDWDDSGHWDGTKDKQFIFGQSGDVPVPVSAGSNGSSKLAVYRQGQVYVDLNGNYRWDGCSVDSCTSFGAGTEVAFADPSGHLALSRDSLKVIDSNSDFMGGSEDAIQYFGTSSMIPLLGNYQP